MNAVEFLKEERRMCESFEQGCLKCLLRDTRCRAIPGETDEGIEKEVAIVERWSREHPNKTRQTELLNMFPEAHVSENGSLYICPASVSSAYRSVGAVAEMAWIFYTAIREVGADVTEATLLTRQYLIATMIASMHGKDRDTTEDDDG